MGPDGRRGRRSPRRDKQNARGGVVACLATVAPGLYAISYEELFGARYRRRDGIEQIAEALAGQSGMDAIHLVTHGSQA